HDGSLVLTLAPRGGVRVFRASSGRLVRVQDRDGAIAAAFSPDGRTLATADRSGRIRLWNAGTGRLVRELGRHAGGVRDVSFSPDGRLLVSASADGTARVWRPATGGLVRTLSHSGPVDRAPFSPDGAL